MAAAAAGRRHAGSTSYEKIPEVLRASYASSVTQANTANSERESCPSTVGVAIPAGGTEEVVREATHDDDRVLELFEL
jgi:hypothetical protein